MNDATCISNLCTKSRSDWNAYAPNLPPGIGQTWIQDPTNKFRITIHHAGADYSQTTDAAVVKAIQEAHQNPQGDLNSPDIAYHFLVGGYKDTTACVFYGRAISVKGAHTELKNDGNIGICALGNFATTFMPQNQWNSLVNWTAKMAKDYNINPFQELKRHKDLKATTCPGNAWTDALWTQFVKNVASVKQVCFN